MAQGGQRPHRRGALGRGAASLALLVAGLTVPAVNLASAPDPLTVSAAVAADAAPTSPTTTSPTTTSPTTTSPTPTSPAATIPASAGPAQPDPAAAGAAGAAPDSLEPSVAATLAAPTAEGPRWVGTWATAAVKPAKGQALAGFRNTTIRQRVHVSLGGSSLRVRLTNVYGSAPLRVDSVTVARADRKPGATRPRTLTRVTFSGRAGVIIPRGAELASDPVRLAVPSDSNLLVSLHVPGRTGPATYHPAARTTGWTAWGDHTTDATSSGFAGRTSSYWFLDGIDVMSTSAGAVAFVGDSITDGAGSTSDADRRWTDDLADRMLSRPVEQRFGVLNAGISGNRLLRDSPSPGQGQSVLARLQRDGLDQTGVRTVVLFVGVNDIQQDPVQKDPAAITAGYERVVARARADGLRVVGATIAPFRGWPHWSPQREAVRQKVNAWVRTSGVFDDYLDFDAVLRDPTQRQRLRPAYDSGDHLHPGDRGYAAMAASVDLDSLLP